MKVELFNTVIYYGKVEDPWWPVAPRKYDPELGMQSMEWAFEQADAAYEAGFDSINFAEHHYTPNRLSPNPNLYAAIVGRRLPKAGIGVFGTALPIVNPIRAAEEFAMLDNLLQGRLRFGLLRGTPNEYLTYGHNPWESRDRFEEGVRLFIHALTEPEPFGWEGRYFRFRQVAVWPRPVQQPYPRILLSGTSPTSAAFTGRMKADLGFSYASPDKCAENLVAYRDAATSVGWTPTEDNVTLRSYAYVAETDAEAIRDVESWGWPNEAGVIPVNPEIRGVLRTAGAAMAGVPKGSPPEGSRPPFTPYGPFVGSPDTVLEQMQPFIDAGIGRFELVLSGVGVPPHDAACRAIRLMGETIVPALHAMESAPVAVKS